MNESRFLSQGRLPEKHGRMGFSLIELMIAITLGVFLIGAVILTFITGRSAASDAERLARIQEDIRIISEFAVRDIRNAGYVDEGTLTVGREGLVRRGFAQITNGVNGLAIRYAGRGHCAQTFNEVVLVENEYLLDGDVLVCRGRNVPLFNADGTPYTVQETDNWEDHLANPEDARIASGITELVFSEFPTGCSFSTLDPDGNENLGNVCLGVRIGLSLRGPQDVNRPIELTAAFRNAIIQRVNAGVP